MEKEICLAGSYESCPNGGTPSNTCPNGYDKGSPTENNSSSSKNVFGGLSSSSGGYTGVYGSVEHCGKTYKTVVIGTQTWFTENVNCSTASGSKCHDDPTNCSKYGRLYDWETAKTVCSTGWHLPDSTEWETLLNYAGGRGKAGKKLKANSGWIYEGNGTDELGFSALPGGAGSFKLDEGFFEVGNNGYWWTATNTNNDGKDDGPRYILMHPETDEVKNSSDGKNNGNILYSVRCVASSM